MALSVKDLVNGCKDKLHMEKNICRPLSDKRPVSSTYKKPSNKNTNKTIRKWVKYAKGHFTEEDIQLENKHIKRCLTSLTIKEM